MKSTIKYILFSLFILAQLGCNIQSPDPTKNDIIEEIDLKENLKELANEIKSKDTVRIKKITTDKGYFSLFYWSDSLRDSSFINHLTGNMKNNLVAEIEDNDSKIYVSLGKLDEIIGATGGYIVLKRKIGRA